jgi:hypothetical protein
MCVSCERDIVSIIIVIILLNSAQINTQTPIIIIIKIIIMSPIQIKRAAPVFRVGTLTEQWQRETQDMVSV